MAAQRSRLPYITQVLWMMAALGGPLGQRGEIAQRSPGNGADAQEVNAWTGVGQGLAPRCRENREARAKAARGFDRQNNEATMGAKGDKRTSTFLVIRRAKSGYESERGSAERQNDNFVCHNPFKNYVKLVALHQQAQYSRNP